MSTDVAEIEAKIRSLSLEDKTELIRSLIQSLMVRLTLMSSAYGYWKRKDAIVKSLRGK